MPSTLNRDWLEHAEQSLRRAGYRAASGRQAVLECLAGHDCLMAAQEIDDELRAEGRQVGVATVYRALELLHGLGLLRRFDGGEGIARYEPADPTGEHHHHVICDRCGHVTAFADAQLERQIDRVARRLDHRIDAHDIVLHGACPACRGRR